MAHTAFTIALVSVLANSTLGQTVASPESAAQSTPPITTLRSTVRLVDLDIVVTDSKGVPVTGLTQEDFKVEEDKVFQPVRSFDVHTAVADGSFRATKVPALAPNTFLNLQTVPEAGTPTVLLYDALNTSLTQQSYARQELLQFIKHRRPGTQIALFVLGTKLRMLQGFTQDTDLLSAALIAQTGSPHALALQRGSSELSPTPGGMDGDLQFDTVLKSFALMDGSDSGQLTLRRWETTINALTEMGRFLAGVPGRKNLVWFSSAFQASIFRSDDPRESRYDSAHLKAMRQVRDLLSLSHTAVYPVDVQGVRARPIFDAARNASFGPDGQKVRGAQRLSMIQDNAAQEGMDAIADATGGHAFYGTNDLREAMDQAIIHGSSYYTLSYSPTNPKYDGSLRHIKVTLKKPGYTLAYRKTYYADDLEAAERAAADAPQSPLSPALERGTPLAHELFVEAHLDAAGVPAPATAEQMQVLSQFRSMQTKKDEKSAVVMMQQYRISYGLISRQLETPEDEKGSHEVSLEFGLIAYDEDGGKLNGVDTRIDDAVPPERYAKLASEGYRVAQTVAVPVTAASLRLAVRDIHSNRTGSLEVRLPLAKTADSKR